MLPRRDEWRHPDVGVLRRDRRLHRRRSGQRRRVNKAVLKTALEECIHWITKAGDNSRDLQDFAFRMIVEILG